MKKLYTILLLLLVLLAAALGVLSLVDQDATESKTENRKLATLPEFSWAELLHGSYLSDLETYYSDTFPGREMLLKANQKLNGFYHFSGSGDENVLVLDYQGGAEQGGQSLAPVPEEKPEQTEPVPEELPSEETMAPEPEQIEPEPEEDPEEDDTENLEYTSAGSVIIVGDRAMDIPYATDSIVKDYAAAVGNLQTALGEDVRVISLVTPNAAQFYSPKVYSPRTP